MNTKRLKIGIDIDGVLIDTDQEAYLRHCKEDLGWDIDFKVFFETHSWYKATKDKKTTEELGHAFEQYIADIEDSQHPIDGAHDALKTLSEVADLYLITARRGVLRSITEEFLQEHLPDIRYQEVSMDNIEAKARRVIEFGVDYYIDDSFREISLILRDRSVDTVVIPFPAFHGVHKWQELQDSRMHWLSVWDEVKDGMSATQHPEIRKKAWEEIVDMIIS